MSTNHWKKQKQKNLLHSMTNTNIDTLLTATYSLKQLRNRLRVLRNSLLGKFFSAKEDVEITKKNKTWLVSLPDDFLKQFEKTNVYEKLDSLEKEINNIKPLTIYLAFEIPDEETETLGTYLRREIKPDLVFDVKLDPSLIGGCALSWKGIYKDYSLRASIQAKREQILSSLKQIAK